MSTALRKIHAFILLVAVVTAMTWVLGLLDYKYSVDANLAFTDGFPGELSSWERAGDWSNIDIDKDRITVRRDAPDRSYAKRTFVLPALSKSRSDSRLRVRGLVETVQRVDNPSDTRGAAYMIWLEDAQDEVLKYLTIQELRGHRDSYLAERIISIPDEAQAFTLVLNSRDSSSSFSLTDASVELLSVTPMYKVGLTVLICSWLFIFALCVKWLYQNASGRLFVTASILVSIIIIGVLLPESLSGKYLEPIFQMLSSLFPAFDTEAAESTYKVGHFLFFFLISLVLMINARSLRISRRMLLCLLLLLAIASEGMQLHLFNRTTRLFDLGIDGSGIILGWLIALAFKPSRRKRRRRRA